MDKDQIENFERKLVEAIDAKNMLHPIAMMKAVDLMDKMTISEEIGAEK